MANIGLMLKGSAVIIEAATAGRTILAITVLFVAYGLAGGLTAAIVTDFIQGLLTILFSFLLLPLVLNIVGGLAGMKARLAAQHSSENIMSLVAPDDISVFSSPSLPSTPSLASPCSRRTWALAAPARPRPRVPSASWAAR